MSKVKAKVKYYKILLEKDGEMYVGHGKTQKAARAEAYDRVKMQMKKLKRPIPKINEFKETILPISRGPKPRKMR